MKEKKDKSTKAITALKATALKEEKQKQKDKRNNKKHLTKRPSGNREQRGSR